MTHAPLPPGFGRTIAALVLALVALAVGGPVPARADAAPSPAALRVCADPDNLPFSNERGEGFENRIARAVADELRLPLRYAWSPQRRGFLRRTLGAGACDLVLGVPEGLDGVSTLRPYYVSSYAFVSARDRHLHLRAFDDLVLAHLKIGLPAIGVEGANPPPAAALALRGLGGSVVGFPPRPTSGDATAAGEIVDAVAAGEIDAAVLWGPSAGYHARRHGDRLEVVPVLSDPRQPGLAFVYPITAAVRRGDEAFGARVQDALDRRRDEIRAILEAYGVPLVAPIAKPTAERRPPTPQDSHLATSIREQ
jgi:quinoprotein dehydrogenase-associated probable ABC transporter substrate-binding protein